MLTSAQSSVTASPATQVRTGQAWMMAKRLEISEQTVWEWRNQLDLPDRSHTLDLLQTTLNPSKAAALFRE